MDRLRSLATLAPLLGLALVACSPSAGEPVRFTLETLSASGVSGTVTLTPVDASTTTVEVEVDPAGHPNMPAHIHPGSCDELVPQPRYPLTSVVDGRSITQVPAGLAELLSGNQAINLHASNEEMQIYTACVDLH